MTSPSAAEDRKAAMISLRACIACVALGLMVPTGAAAEDPAPPADLRMQVLDLVYTVEDIGGKVTDLQLKETDTEIRIELAADVLFDFDKAEIKLQVAYDPNYTGKFIQMEVGDPSVFIQLPAEILGEGVSRLPGLATSEWRR